MGSLYSVLLAGLCGVMLTSASASAEPPAPDRDREVECLNKAAELEATLAKITKLNRKIPALQHQEEVKLPRAHTRRVDSANRKQTKLEERLSEAEAACSPAPAPCPLAERYIRSLVALEKRVAKLHESYTRAIAKVVKKREKAEQELVTSTTTRDELQRQIEELDCRSLQPGPQDPA